jgi:hypothetical protein
MRRKKLLSEITCIVCLLFLLSACSPAATPTPTSNATALRSRPTRTPLAPTALLATATPLPLPTETASPAPTATLTPAPLVDFSTASLYSAGILPRFQALITIKVNAVITGEYYGIVQGNKTYTCTTFSDRPHLLYCTGPLAAVEKYVHFELFQKGLDYPIFQADAYMPLQITLSP